MSTLAAGYIAGAYGYNSVFTIATGFVVLSLFLVVTRLPETKAPDTKTPGPRQIHLAPLRRCLGSCEASRWTAVPVAATR